MDRVAESVSRSRSYRDLLAWSRYASLLDQRFAGLNLARMPFIPLCLLLMLGVQVVLSMKQTSITYDEFAHLPAGYSYLKTGDFRMYNHNPPLIKLIAALPLLVTEARLPESSYWDSPEIPVRPWFYGTDFMRANRAQYLNLFFCARLMVLLLSGLLGLLVFTWSRQLYGTAAACFSLFLYTFCPNILAQSSLATVDLGTSLTIFLAVYCFYRYLKTPTSLTLSLSGVTLGLALLSKFTALLLFVIYSLIILARSPWPVARGLLRILLISLIAFGIVNLGYAFQGSFSPLGDYNFTSNFLKPLNHPLLKDIPVPLPFYYLKGFDNQKVKEEHGSETLLLGEVSRTGWWHYYVMVLLFKVPVPLLVLLALVLLKRKWFVDRGSLQVCSNDFSHLFATTKVAPTNSPTIDPRLQTTDSIFLLIPVCVILVAFSFVRLQLGIRYILPILPFLFVYLGQTVHFLSRNKKVLSDSGPRVTVLIIGLSLWYLVSSVSVYPNYLSYFNELAGGPKNGYKILSDANLDVGQGLVQLSRYLTEQGIRKVNLLYFGWVDPNLYGLQANQFPNLSPHGVYAISVAYLQGIPFIRIDTQGQVYRLPAEFFEVFKNLEPVERIAHSIFIYQLTD